VAMGISGGGRSAEKAFRLLTGAMPAERAALGDAVLEGHLVEIKQATANTLNQVRAVKYLPIVIYYTPTASWYVIPAHRVVARVARKIRGQHTENPFESATLSLREFADTLVPDPSDLRDATIQAIAESDQYRELRDEMALILRSARESAADSRRRVTAVLQRLGLNK
jgi:hypothetical protein